MKWVGSAGCSSDTSSSLSCGPFWSEPWCSTHIEPQLKGLASRRCEELPFPQGRVHHAVPCWQKPEESLAFVSPCHHISHLWFVCKVVNDSFCKPLWAAVFLKWVYSLMHVCAPRMHLISMESEEGFRGTKDRDVCDLGRRYWEPNPSPLKEQKVLWSSAPSAQSL